MTIYSFPFHGHPSSAGVRREVDRFVNEVFGAPRASVAFAPVANVSEDSAGFSLSLELPGVSPEQVELFAEDGVLTVRGEKTVPALADGAREVASERARGSFERRFRLPKSANVNAIEASYQHGVLSVRVAKVEPAQPRRVQINVEGSTPA